MQSYEQKPDNKAYAVGKLVKDNEALKVAVTRMRKFALTAERDKFNISAFEIGIHGTAEGRVVTVNHLVNVINDSMTGM